MTTHTPAPSELQHPATSASSPATPRWAGPLSAVLALAGLVLICLNDPAWLAFPSSLAAVVLGGYAVRRGHDRQLAAQVGLNVGLLDILLWVVFILVIQVMFDANVWLFDLPAASS